MNNMIMRWRRSFFSDAVIDADEYERIVGDSYWNVYDADTLPGGVPMEVELFTQWEYAGLSQDTVSMTYRWGRIDNVVVVDSRMTTVDAAQKRWFIVRVDHVHQLVSLFKRGGSKRDNTEEANFLTASSSGVSYHATDLIGIGRYIVGGYAVDQDVMEAHQSSPVQYDGHGWEVMRTGVSYKTEESACLAARLSEGSRR